MNAVVTYIYPDGMIYFDSLLKSLCDQSNNDFDLIIFNDGVGTLNEDDEKLKNLNFGVRIFPMQGSIAEIRFESFEILKRLNYDGYIFQDVDDQMSINRVELCKELLSTNDVVVNDLKIVTEDGDLAVWKERIKDLQIITLSDIRRSNIIGLGNTSIRRSILKQTPLRRSSLPKAVDWFVFYQILHRGAKACFTGKCATIYRQHENNLAGMQKLVTKERLQHIIDVKKRHYSALSEIGLEDFILELTELKNKQLNKNILLTKNPFWWEETELI